MPSPRKVFYLWILGLAVSWPAAAEPPWSVNPRHPLTAAVAAPAEAPDEAGTLSRPFLWGIRLFQLALSPADGQVCNFWPTCSAYGAQAVARFGPLLGTALACERILRDHHDGDGYRFLLRQRQLYFYDPLEENLFWQSAHR